MIQFYGTSATGNYSVDNLEKNKTYTIYVISKDKADNIRKSEEITVTTLAGEKVEITLQDSSKTGGTVEYKDGIYTLTGPARLKSSEVLNLKTYTMEVEVKNLQRYYTSYTTTSSFSGLIIGVGASGANTQSICTGIADGWGGTNIINPFTGSGGYYYADRNKLNQDEWNKLAITWDGSTFKFFINGDLQYSTTSSSLKNTPLYIGGWIDAEYTSAGVYWGFVNGQYRNINVYDYAIQY